MNLQLNFADYLPTHLCPSYTKVVSLLNQTVAEWPKGSAMLTGNRGVFTIKLWDKSKGEKLVGKKVEYFYEGEASTKSVKQEKPTYLRYVNPKYITLVGFERTPADLLIDDNIDRVLKEFGTIINTTQDVFAENFLTGKKKLRLDLNKGKRFHVTSKSKLKHQQVNPLQQT